MAEGSAEDQAGGRSRRWPLVVSGFLAASVLVVAVVAFSTDSSTAPAGDGAIHDGVADGPLPVISGEARAGQTLHAALSRFTPRHTEILTKWVRCDATGADCHAIPQTNPLAYTLTAADVGAKIRFEDVQRTSRGYGKPAISAATMPVTGSASAASSRVLPVAARREASTEATATFSEVIAAWDLREQIATSLRRQVPLPSYARVADLVYLANGTAVRFTALTGGWLSLRYSIAPGEHGSKPGPVILTGRETFPRAGTQVVKLRLTAAGRRILGSHLRVRLFSAGRFTAMGHLGVRVEAKGL